MKVEVETNWMTLSIYFSRCNLWEKKRFLVYQVNIEMKEKIWARTVGKANKKNETIIIIYFANISYICIKNKQESIRMNEYLATYNIRNKCYIHISGYKNNKQMNEDSIFLCIVNDIMNKKKRN